jgi:hypothetical protein
MESELEEAIDNHDIEGIREHLDEVSRDSIEMLLDTYDETIDTNEYMTEVISLFMENGAVITFAMVDDIIDKKQFEILPILLRKAKPFKLSQLMAFLTSVFHKCPRASDECKQAIFDILSLIAKQKIDRNTVQSILDNLINTDEIYLAYFVKALGIPVDDLVEYAQETTPRPITSDRAYPQSGRAITNMKRILGHELPTIKADMSMWKVEKDELCFCFDIPIGLYDHLVYIPVTRYGQSAGMGYYGDEEYTDPSFTWYYVEPDSLYVLRSNKMFVARNKYQAFLLLYKLILNKKAYEADFKDIYKNITIEYNPSRMYEYYQDPSKIDMLQDLEPFMKSTEVNVSSNMTNYFRDWKTKKIYFEHGRMDHIDEVLSDMMNNMGYEVLVLTHQSGNYGRLVSECLDSRKRTVSFSNIFKRDMS